ncbi:T-cell surface glycoprotein CD3 epsilon chain [Mastacembelus armatus]|uniref:CD3e molecule n=1 Tax=Mastacembelus armatus TaxID=205130 RepID=A0A7N8YEE8_9TELE|nr:T-cell surface glycoprotein CD3 epsilon chain [Mastacembelus armatus]
MNNLGVRAVLVVLLFVPSVKAVAGSVTFWRETYTMTCPEKGEWFLKGDNVSCSSEESTCTVTYNGKNKGPYFCKYTDHLNVEKKYYFYVQGKVCENCFELDGTIFMLIVVLDIVATIFVILLIYMNTKKKSSSGPMPTSKAPARSGGRAPPVPSPDYEPLSTHTRSQDTYSTVVNKTG